MEFAENTLSEHKLQIQTTITQREVTRAHAQEILTNQKLQSLRTKKERGPYLTHVCTKVCHKYIQSILIIFSRYYRSTKNLQSSSDNTVHINAFGIDVISEDHRTL